ncbi:cache domain-containing protein [Thalassotalea sp. ND16A]|uniref:cache domain-containing protein n=1 Tax=Thalassotalea sp. ND16A TaxID=1535422 RepID=UPI00051A3552|nr:cache domain-containing protein [Thalassotalea sp. ND16A]KGK00589.1 hypothetical protein ND16A_3349 [Thalassotalea sp. ND16A]
MNINHRFYLFTILPLVIATVAVLIVTQVQFKSLSDQVALTYRTDVIEHRRDELKNYVKIAKGAVDHLYQGKTLSTAEYQARVKQVLSNMRFGEDGYFYAYDYQGTNLVLPGQEWRIGTNMYDLEDINGVKIIQGLINNGQQGGGYLNYVFNQPSKQGAVSKKLAYSEDLDKWQWIIGTGVYIDDIDEQTSLLNDAITAHINDSSVITLLIGLLAIISVFVTGLFLQFSERRLANKKLRALNERIFQTQEEECKRFSRELHDGVSQTVAAARFSLETAQLKQQNDDRADEDIDHAMDLIRKIMVDIRSISHQLHPSILEDYGLGAALDDLGQEFTKRTGIRVEVQRLKVRNILTTEIKTALYRIAQEAMTNIERHSNASLVSISLKLIKDWLVLEITDDGQGFDFASVKKSNKCYEGIGLRNIKERLQFYDGRLEVTSRQGKTSIIARIPQSRLRYNADIENTDIDKPMNK